MTLERIDTSTDAWTADPRLADYRVVRDPELVKRSARFIAEGRLVARRLLVDSPLEALSVLLDETALPSMQDALDARPDVPAYVVPRGALRELAGWQFHQGCLAVGVRPAARDVDQVLTAAGDPRLVVALDTVSNPDNVGAIFRSAAALGAGAVVLGPTCVSPLYRKAIRSSMGAALVLPFVHGPAWEESLAALKARGHALLAMTPAEGSESLEAVASDLGAETRRTLILGAEGDGLGEASLAHADRLVAIAMDAGVDSLNVAAAAAIALYCLREA